MACNCKKAAQLRKLDDDYTPSDDKFNFFEKISAVIAQAFFGIIAGTLLIIGFIPALLYVIGCMIIGKEPVFTIKKFSKKH